MIRYFLVLLALILQLQSQNQFDTAAPTWVTSSFFRAGNQNVINRLTGQNQTPQFTFIFSSPLPGVPKLAYGVKNYRGNDYFGQERFQVRRISVTASTFRVAVQIYGVTNIHILNVPYIAIDPTFPFEQFRQWGLTNITQKQTSQTQYRNVINYTQQATGMTYTRFKSPLSNNRILLYIMALDIFSTFGSGSDLNPIDLRVSATILTEQTYEFKATLSTKTSITLIHFSQIMFDQADVQSSLRYYIITEYYDLPQQGGFIPLPEQFMDNFIMGLTDFSTDRGRSSLNYNWQFYRQNGVFGVLVLESAPGAVNINVEPASLIRQGTMIFYMKTWLCPDGYDFFNLTTNLCQDMCGDYFYEDNSDYQCEYCSYTCTDCTSGRDCLSCSGDVDNRVMTGDRACSCQPGYYERLDSTVCEPCSNILDHCVDCFYNTSYNSGDTGSILYGCFQCDQTTFLENNVCNQYLICTGATVLNVAINRCEACTIEGCIDCQSMTECAQCDASANKYLNTQTKKCQSCSIQFCTTCSGLQTCSACKQSFNLYYNHCVCPSYHYLDLSDQSCIACSAYCKSCRGPSAYECTSCYYDQHRVLVGGGCICDEYNYDEPAPGTLTLECQKKDLLKCDRGYIYISQSDECIELCGDGVKLGVECDDGNIVNGDGCSDQCFIEQQYTCSVQVNEKSVCKVQGTIEVGQISIFKDPSSNSLTFTVDIEPDTDTYNNYNLAEILEFTGADIQILEARYQNGALIIITTYSQDLVGEQVQLKIKDEYYYGPDSPQYPDNIYTTSKATFKLGSPKAGPITISDDEKILIKTYNNLDAFYYTEQEYEIYNQALKVSTATTVVGLIAAGATLFMKNSLPTLVIVSGIQICFIGLASIQGLNPVSQAMINIRPVLGFNQVGIQDEEDKVESTDLKNRISALGYNDQFANNYNVMLFCTAGLFSITALFYLASLKRASMKVAHRIMQKEVMLFVFFNMTNLFFSLSNINGGSTVSIILSIVASGLFLYQAIHFLVNAKTYFGMENTFDFSNYYFAIFFVTYVISRLCVSIINAHISDPEYSAIGTMVSQGIFVIVICVLRPFLHLLNNIFVILGQVLVMSFFATIYAMEGLKSSEWTSGWAMLGITGGIAVFGVANIAYSIYKDCSAKNINKKNEKVFVNVDSFSS